MKIDKKTIVIIALSIIIISIVGIYAYNQIQEKAYQEGISNASLLINQQILNNLQQQGYINFIYSSNNETYNIKLGVIEN